MQTITLLTGQVSDVYSVSPGSRVTMTGSGNIQWTAGSKTDALNNPSWADWPLGTTAGNVDVVRPMCIRATATGSMTVTIDDVPGDKQPDGVYWDSQLAAWNPTQDALVHPVTGLPYIRPVTSYTWATRPAAASNTGVTIRITDIGGSAGSRWISDGAYWKPESGRVVLGSGSVGLTDPNDTTENILASVLVPASCMGTNGCLSIVHSWSLTSSANSKTLAIRLGAAGVITGSYLLSSAQTNINSIRMWTELQNRNNAASQVGGTGSANSLLSGGIAGVLWATTENTAIDRYLVFTGKKDAGAVAASDAITLERYIVELIVP